MMIATNQQIINLIETSKLLDPILPSWFGLLILILGTITVVLGASAFYTLIYSLKIKKMLPSFVAFILFFSLSFFSVLKFFKDEKPVDNTKIESVINYLNKEITLSPDQNKKLLWSYDICLKSNLPCTNSKLFFVIRTNFPYDGEY